MISLIEKLLKKNNSDLTYILPEYQPAPINMVSANSVNYYVVKTDEAREVDEMQIDNIYRCS